MVNRQKTIVNLANGLSLLRMLLAPVFFVLVLKGEYVQAFIVLLVATLTDFIDGTVARLWKMQTRVGKMLDPTADKVIVFFAVLALVLKFDFPLWIACIIVLRDLVLLVGSFIFLFRNRGKVLVPNKVGKVTAFVQMSTMVAWLTDLHPTIKQVFLAITVVMTILSMVIYFHKGYELLFKKQFKIKHLANKITLLRILFIPVFVWILLSSLEYRTLLAAIVFSLLAFSDAIDGYVARKRKEVTTFGKLVDPLADKLLVSAALIFLIGKGVESWMAYTIIAREFIVTGLRAIYATHDEALAAKMSGKIKTVSQIVAIVWVLLAFPHGDLVMALATAITIFSGLEYIWDARKLLAV